MKTQIYPSLFIWTAIFVMFGVLLCSCARYNYVQQMPITPMFEKGGEHTINTALSWNHVELQGAYAVAKNLAVEANLFAAFKNPYAVSYGLSYFKPIGDNYLSVTGGYQKANADYEWNQPLSYIRNFSSFNYEGYYTEGTYYGVNELTDIRHGVSLKFSNAKYYHLSTGVDDYDDIGGVSNFMRDSLYKSSSFQEISLFYTRYRPLDKGIGHIKMQIGIGLPIKSLPFMVHQNLKYYSSTFSYQELEATSKYGAFTPTYLMLMINFAIGF